MHRSRPSEQRAAALARRSARLCGIWLLLCAGLAAAQVAPPVRAPLKVPLAVPGDGERAAQRPAALPRFADAPEGARREILPPLVLPAVRDLSRGRAPLAGGPRLRVAGYRVRGSTRISEPELLALTAPYSGREVRFEELLALRDQLTLLYVKRGYVTSGAVLSPTLAADGVVEFEIVEGTLHEVRISGAEHFRPAQLRARLGSEPGSVVQVQELEEGLQRLQRDPRIRRVHARLVPAVQRGQADLDLQVEEFSPYRLSLRLDNHQSASVGSHAGRVRFAHLNLTGRGDTLGLDYSRAPGLHQWDASYEHPLGSRGASLAYRYGGARSRVVEEPFRDAQIESRSESYALELRQPLLDRDAVQLELAASASYRRGQTLLDGEGSALGSGTRSGVTRLAVLELGADLALRGERRVLAARSTLRWGLDAFGALRGAEPDGQFASWLTQLQWAQRLPLFDATWLARADLQWSSDPLPGLERIGIGGHASVRGYRENRLVRDSGWVVSTELRVPLARRADEEPWLELAPFFDVGSGWNRRRLQDEVRTIHSAGVGVLLHVRKNMHVELYYAHALRDVPDAARHRSWQDRGVHLRVWSAFQ